MTDLEKVLWALLEPEYKHMSEWDQETVQDAIQIIGPYIEKALRNAGIGAFYDQDPEVGAYYGRLHLKYELYQLEQRNKETH